MRQKVCLMVCLSHLKMVDKKPRVLIVDPRNTKEIHLPEEAVVERLTQPKPHPDNWEKCIFGEVVLDRGTEEQSSG